MDQGIRMNMVAGVAIQRNSEREAVADVFEGVFVGELFLFSFILRKFGIKTASLWNCTTPQRLRVGLPAGSQ